MSAEPQKSEPANVVKPVRLLEHVTSDYKRVASKTRHYSKIDQEFIIISGILRDGVIEGICRSGEQMLRL